MTTEYHDCPQATGHTSEGSSDATDDPEEYEANKLSEGDEATAQYLQRPSASPQLNPRRAVQDDNPRPKKHAPRKVTHNQAKKNQLPEYRKSNSKAGNTTGEVCILLHEYISWKL